MIWKGLVVATGSETPVVVVLSGSMEPAIWRGDILFLWQDRAVPYEIGEIVVYQIKGRTIPIIHRIIEVHRDEPSGKLRLLTKGDNNPTEDRALYNPDGGKKLWLEEEEVLGRAKGSGEHKISDTVGTGRRGSEDSWGRPTPTPMPSDADRSLTAFSPSAALSAVLSAHLLPLSLPLTLSYLPQVGKLTIYLTDYPALKFILIAVLGLFVLTAKE